MSKQTAVDYLFEKLCGENGYVDTYYMDVVNKIQVIYEEAKAMEREQAREHYIAGFNERDDMNAKLWFNVLAREYNEKRFEEYYEITYKGGEQ